MKLDRKRQCCVMHFEIPVHTAKEVLIETINKFKTISERKNQIDEKSNFTGTY